MMLLGHEVFLRSRARRCACDVSFEAARKVATLLVRRESSSLV